MVIGVTDGLPQGPRDHRRRLPRPARRQEAPAQPGLQPPHRDRPARGHRLRGREPHPPRGRRHRQGARRPRRRAGPRDPQARALQGQGRPLRGRGRPPQGRQGRQDRRQEVTARRSTGPATTTRSRVIGARTIKETTTDHGHGHQPQRRPPQAPRAASACTWRGRPSGRAWPSSAASTRSTPRSSTTPRAARSPAPRRSRPACAAAAGTKTERAKQVGTLVAERAKAAGVEQVVFDRAGFRYHGRVARARRRRARSRPRLLGRSTRWHGSIPTS